MTPAPFIDSLARDVITNHGSSIDLRDQTYVFPNRRAGLFFTRALSRLSADHGTIALPHVTDINRFVEEHSSLRRADDTELLIWLFRAFTIVNPSDTPHHLKSFIELGSKILHDFNEIDKYLVDAHSLFRNIDDLSGLTANTNEDIRHFYDTLLSKSDDQPLLFHQRFSSLWRIIPSLYDSFRSLLRSHGIAYEGMLFRDFSNAEGLPVFDKPIVFAGFNILTESEKRIIEKFSARRMVFDYNALTRADTEFDYRAINTRDFAFNVPSDIRAYPCMTSAEQGDSLRRAMESISKDNPDLESNTAIILADESMLVEALSNLSSISRLNITMGYPLANTQIANFVNLIIRLQLSIEVDSDGQEKVYHKPLFDLLSHPYFPLYSPADPSSLLASIRERNLSRIPLPLLQTLDPLLFSRTSDPLGYLISVLNRLLDSINREDNPAADTEIIDHHFIRQYTERITSLRSYLTAASVSADEAETYTLIRRLTRGMKVQFLGEPLQGLQVMGLLECRLLDFDNIVFVGFNDQFVPGSASLNNSIIPYSLRRPYGLPSHEITNSIYAYNFYRMLHRCSSLHLIYATATNEDSRCEVSRFLNQLKYIHKSHISDANAHIFHTVNEASNLFTPFFRIPAEPLSISHVSASSLKKFITCPIRFYYEYLMNLRQQDEIDDSISDSIFGNLLHRSLQFYYDEARENQILPEHAILKLIDHVCEKAYAEIIHERHTRGYNILAFNSLRTIVRRIIRFDDSRPKFYDVRTETRHFATFNGFNLFAIIDRIDHMESGEYVVIDYKTSTDLNNASLDRMFSPSEARKYDLEVMQVLFYCAILCRSEEYENARLIPQLFKVYSLTKDDDRKKLTPIRIEVDGQTLDITDYDIIREPFEARLADTLSSLADALSSPERFLLCASTPEHCTYCPFPDLCMMPQH